MKPKMTELLERLRKRGWVFYTGPGDIGMGGWHITLIRSAKRKHKWITFNVNSDTDYSVGQGPEEFDETYSGTPWWGSNWYDLEI